MMMPMMMMKTMVMMMLMMMMNKMVLTSMYEDVFVNVIFSVMMIGEVGPSMGLPNHAPDDAAGARAHTHTQT